MTKHINIDSILKSCYYRDDGTTSYDTIGDEQRRKQQLKDLMLEIIGADISPDASELSRYKYSIKNQLKAKQRQKLEELFND